MFNPYMLELHGKHIFDQLRLDAEKQRLLQEARVRPAGSGVSRRVARWLAHRVGALLILVGHRLVSFGRDAAHADLSLGEVRDLRDVRGAVAV